MTRPHDSPPPADGSSRLEFQYRSLAAALVLLALAGCVQAAGGQEHRPASPDSGDSGAGIRNGGGM